jgi:hypothetical protein
MTLGVVAFSGCTGHYLPFFNFSWLLIASRVDSTASSVRSISFARVARRYALRLFMLTAVLHHVTSMLLNSNDLHCFSQINPD